MSETELKCLELRVLFMNFILVFVRLSLRPYFRSEWRLTTYGHTVHHCDVFFKKISINL
jgi:hypothetical protein